jgi:hypothetical protein
VTVSAPNFMVSPIRTSSGEIRAVTLSSAAKTATGFSIFCANAWYGITRNAMAIPKKQPHRIAAPRPVLLRPVMLDCASFIPAVFIS